jgi:hypothetical protein
MKTATATALTSRSNHSTGPPFDNNTGNVSMAPFIRPRRVVAQASGVRLPEEALLSAEAGLRFALLLAHASRILCAWNNQTSFANCFGCREL